MTADLFSELSFFMLGLCPRAHFLEFEEQPLRHFWIRHILPFWDRSAYFSDSSDTLLSSGNLKILFGFKASYLERTQDVLSKHWWLKSYKYGFEISPVWILTSSVCTAHCTMGLWMTGVSSCYHNIVNALNSPLSDISFTGISTSTAVLCRTIIKPPKYAAVAMLAGHIWETLP